MLVYVMSRPHSGSTILNILLGNSADIVSVGQLVTDIDKPENWCSCGKRIGEDPFWHEVRTRVEADNITWSETARNSTDQAHIRWLWRTLRADPGDAFFSRLAVVTETLTRAITGVGGKPVLCDSSKEATRALFLMKYCPNARMIFLVRHPRSALASHYWRFLKERRFHFLRKDFILPTWMGSIMLVLAATSWTIGNLLSELAVRVAPERVLRVRYEDLCADPATELRRIGRFLGISLEDLIAKQAVGTAFEVGHNIGGNRIRQEAPTIRLDPSKSRAHGLPWPLSLTTLLLCWPLMLCYGYGVDGVMTSATSRARAGSASSARRG